VLQRKIKGFSKGSQDAQAKKEMKASVLTGELFSKDKELQAAKMRLIDQEEEMKRMNLISSKYKDER